MSSCEHAAPSQNVVEDVVEVVPHAARVITRLRERGNAAFRQQDYDLASTLYHQAIQHSRGLENCEVGSAQECELGKLYLNHATALRKLGRGEEALEAAKTASKINPAFTKALFRQGQILSDLGRHEEALMALAVAQAREPGNAEIKKHIRHVEGFTSD